MRVFSNQGPGPAMGPPAAMVIETFADDRLAGSVIGSRGAGGALRRGRDVEHQIAIDHSALRFQPLITPGWGRQGIAYGPFRRQAGLVLAVSLTNGHNTSQGTRNPERFIRRLWRWARGPEADPWPHRMLSLLFSPRRKRLLRRFAWWLRCSGRFYGLPEINENLAVGWFTSEAPSDPKADGCGFIIRAALGDNGEACVRMAGRCAPLFRRLKNIRIYYVVALRQQGAVYYAAASDGAYGFAPFPMMRPIAVDPFNRDTSFYAGVHQCVLGQIGFRVDTRVHGILVQKMPEFATGKGSVQAGDALTGNGPLRTQRSDWRFLQGDIVCTSGGATAKGAEAVAVLEATAPSGLIHVLVKADEQNGAAGLIWRFADADNYWLLRFGDGGAELLRVEQGVATTVATDRARKLRIGAAHSVQITDGCGQIGCYLDGELLFDRWVEDSFEEYATAFGMWFDRTGSVFLRDLESHPRQFPMPASMSFEPPWRRLGERAVIADQFNRDAGLLAGRSPETGNGHWRKVLGRGVIDVGNPGGARVRASVEKPNPGRTFHTVPWFDRDFADLEATIRPPGSGRGQDERCRSGLVFWQDKDNYLSFTAYLDDDYQGGSIALFTKRHGFEELYDAIWTMVDSKISWGKPFRLRVACDGSQFVVLLDDEPVMERALADLYPEDPPLLINQVGLATNWEWGDDTGSVFESFTARG
jgi:hypothetical protein